MNIDSVELHPAGSSLVHVLSFRDPRRLNPYNIASITGLDAESLFPKYYGVSENSADVFYNLTLQQREPVFSIQLNPDFTTGKTYSELRDDLYRTIASSRTGLIEIQFKNGDTVVAILSAWITKFETDLFEQNPTIKLTMTTEYPLLRAPNPVIVNVAGFNPASINIQDLVSTAPHGYDFTITFTAHVNYLSLHPTAVGGSYPWSFKVSPPGAPPGFNAGDVLHFSSDFKTKTLYVVKAGSGGVKTYLADAIDAQSKWPILFPGNNELSTDYPAVFTWTAISYYPTFWGV